MKKKKLLFLWFKLGLIISLVALGVIVSGSGNSDFLRIGLSPAVAQRISPSDIWELVYKELPYLPKNNQYISKETGKVAENNTLVSRLIRYHIYVKGRTPIYRLDWKLTLADYLNANEIIYEASYPGNDSLKENPLEGDRTAIAKLTSNQRNHLVQVLVNIFNSSSGDR
jgi:hypothetical protein